MAINDQHEVSTTAPGRSGWKTYLDACASGAMVFAAASLLWVTWVSPATRSASKAKLALPSRPISLEGAAILGHPTAKVGIVEFSDFQCPYSASFARETLPQIKSAYVTSGKVLLAFRHLPLTDIHPMAATAAEAAECAGRQGKFWDLHDLLFANHRRLDRAGLMEAGARVSADSAGFTDCLDGEMTARIQQDVASARALRVRSTPTFFIGTVSPGGSVTVTNTLSGSRPFNEFQDILDSLLRKTGGK